MRFLLNRLLLLVPVLLGITFIAFTLLHLAPGDPVYVILGEEYQNVELRERIRTELGLDKPMLVQYASWLGKVVSGDLGSSILTRQAVLPLILQRLKTTLLLASLTLVVSLVISIPLGAYSAARRNSWLDSTIRVVSTAGVAVPVFWVGILLILVFGLHLRLLPAGGGLSQHGLKALILPTAALAASFSAILTRVVRSEVMETLQQDYIRTAKAKGVTATSMVMRHGFRNALIPVITIAGAEFGALLSGTVLTEHVFSLAGLGSLMIESIYRRDFPLIQGALLIIGAGFVLVNLLVDLLYVFVDPRIRY